MHSFKSLVYFDIEISYMEGSGSASEILDSLMQFMNPGLYSYFYCALVLLHIHMYSCPIKTHRPSDALSCGISNVEVKSSIYIYYLGQMLRLLYTNVNSSNCVNIRRNVSLQIALIAFFGVYKNPRNLVHIFSVCQYID